MDEFLERVEAILKLLHDQSHVGEIHVEADGSAAETWRLRVRKGKSAPVAMHTAPPEPEEPAGPVLVTIRAGMVGIYRAPGTPVRSSEHVHAGATVGNIDSMRILNPVVAETGGFVVNMLVEDGDPVEYGQELFVLSPEPAADVLEL